MGAAPHSPGLDIAWFTGDRWLAVVGLLVTVAGFLVALWQLGRTRRAAVSAQRASVATRGVLRSADLRRAVDSSLEVSRRLDARGLPLGVVAIHLADWLVAYQRMSALATSELRFAGRLRDEMLKSLDDARGEILVAREAAASLSSWSRYSHQVLRACLVEYGTAAERFLLAIVETDVAQHVE